MENPPKKNSKRFSDDFGKKISEILFLELENFFDKKKKTYITDVSGLYH